MDKIELKQTMSFEEMAQHMQLHSFKLTNRVNVGKYAKNLGYSVYKPMIDGRIQFYYVNESIPKF